MKRFFLVSLAAALPALASPYDQPWSIITVDRARSADPNLRPVIVNRVDGESVMSTNEAVVKPGPHQVTIDLPARKGFNVATQHTFALETRPCVRYHVAAKLDSPTTQDWKPVVRSTEPIGECERKFRVAAGR